MSGVLSVSLLGSFSVLLDGRPLHALETPRLRALVAFLLLRRTMPPNRNVVAESIWPELEEAESRSNLRKLLYRLNQGLPGVDDFLEISPTSIGFKPTARIELDVDELERLCRGTPTAESLREVSSLYRGELLQGCEDEWVLPERERLHRLVLGFLEVGATRLELARQYAEALTWARRVVQLDPLLEQAYAREMRLHALCGDKAAALQTYRTCVATLERELGESCDPALTAEYQRLLGGDSRSPVTQSAGRLVGRQEEWKVLRETWKTASAGSPTLLMLRGEAGRGKTRLIEELKLWVERQGGAVASVRCHETSSELAFSVVAELLKRQPLTGLLPVWLTELTRLLPELAESRPELPLPRPMVEPWQQLRFFQAITRAFLTRQPLLLVVDDIHWCDAHSLKWLHHLFGWNPAPRVLVLSALRSGEDPPGDYLLARLMPSLRRTGQLVELELPPLDPAHTLELATEERGAPLEPAQATLLLQESSGNPLFVLELLRGGYLSVSEKETRPIPPTLRGIILSRLKGLSAAGSHVLSLAAVAGDHFSLRLLRQALSTEPRALVEGLEELMGRQLLRELQADYFEFTHPRLHDIIYAELSSARRALLHQLLAETLVQMPPGLETPGPQLIAYHFEKSGQPLAAVPHLVHAAQLAWQKLDAEEALRIYTRALDLLHEGEHPDLCWQVLLDREQLYGMLGRSELRQADQAVLQRLLDARPERLRGAVLKSRQAQLAATQGASSLAQTLACAALDDASRVGDRRLELELLLLLGHISHRHRSFTSAVQYGERALLLARELADPVEEIAALSQLSSARVMCWQLDRALETAQSAVERAQASGQLRLVSLALGSLGTVLLRCGRPAEAVGLFEEAAEAARTLQDRALELRHTGNLGNARSQARQLVAALRAYDAVEQLNVEIQDRQTVVLLRMHRTHLGITLGRYAEAFAGCEEAIAHSDASGTVYDMLEVLHGYASAYNEIEAYSEAERLSRLGLDRSEALSSAPVPSQVLAAAQLKRDLGVALVGLGRHAEGVAVLESVLETLQGSAFAPFRLLTYAELVAALLPTGDQSHFIEPMLALLPVGWTNLRRPEFVYLMCYRLLSAAGRTAEARELIKEGQRLLLETVAQLETQDDVHSYILNVPPNRRLYEALVKEGLLSTELPKPGAASRRPHR